MYWILSINHTYVLYIYSIWFYDTSYYCNCASRERYGKVAPSTSRVLNKIIEPLKPALCFLRCFGLLFSIMPPNTPEILAEKIRFLWCSTKPTIKTKRIATGRNGRHLPTDITCHARWGDGRGLRWYCIMTTAWPRIRGSQTKPKEFQEIILPRYYKLSKLSSFQRQPNLYDFLRLTSGR